MHCARRRAWPVLKEALPALVADAAAVLPDRLADIPGLGTRPVRAIDGTYQGESAHFRRCTPKEGGEDNPKGHALLSFYNLRLGVPEDVHVETRSRHETAILRDYDRSPQALTRVAVGEGNLNERGFVERFGARQIELVG